MTLLARLTALVSVAPSGATVTVGWLGELLAAETDAALSTVVDSAPEITQPATWRERLWTCPSETRLGVRELAEALDRSSDWVYRATSAKLAAEHGRDPLPCQRLDGSLVFTATAVRDWLHASEVVVNPAPHALRRLRKA